MSYTIQKGDTLWEIAQRHGVSVEALEAANPGVNASNLQIGQHINLSGGARPDTPQQPVSGGGFVNYSGPPSHYPDPSKWASWDTLWAQNVRLMKYHDSDSEINDIKTAIETVAKESGLDKRAILCMIVQESGGNVRIPTTDNGVRNPGLMQSHNGAEFNPKDPAGSILQMVRDGSEGTKYGDGLKQLYAKYHNYYVAFRAYNSGSVNMNNLNDPVGATADYVVNIANRLMGHTWSGM